MKRLKSLLLVIVMMFVSIMNVNAEGVSINDIRLVDSTGDASEVSAPKTSGLNINFDLSFANVNDSVKYEVVLSNQTNREYEINTDKQFTSSNYISYSYELKDKTNRIKANSDVVLYITINYEKIVPVDKLIDGKYIENNTLGINLLNEENPNTFSNILLLVLMILVLVGLTIIMIKYKRKNILVIVIALLLVPVTVFALEKLNLTISTKITIAKESYDVYYGVGNLIKEENLNSVDYYDGCEPIKLKDSNNNYEDYLLCDDLYVKDSTKHVAGEMVEIKTGIVNFLFKTSNCYNDNGIKICPIGSAKINEQATDFKFRCGVDLENNSYTSNYGKKLLNKCSEEEFINMFNNPTLWEGDYGIVDQGIPSAFVMPSHDVYIYRYIMIFS